MSAGGYYDIDSILSEEVRVPCVFALDAVGMGMLDPTTSDEDLSQGAKVRRNLLLGRSSRNGIGENGGNVPSTTGLCVFWDILVTGVHFGALGYYNKFGYASHRLLLLCGTPWHSEERQHVTRRAPCPLFTPSSSSSSSKIIS